MPVEWQGDHKLLGDEKPAFERELKRLGFEPGNFLVEVRREPDAQDGGGPDTIRYSVFITDTAHLDHETCRLRGGKGKDWVAEYAKVVTRHR